MTQSDVLFMIALAILSGIAFLIGMVPVGLFGIIAIWVIILKAAKRGNPPVLKCPFCREHFTGQPQGSYQRLDEQTGQSVTVEQLKCRVCGMVFEREVVQ